MNITVAPFWQCILPGMFPMFEEALNPCSDAHMRVIATLEFLRPEDWLTNDFAFARGRPKKDRSIFLRAYIAKAVLNISTTVALIDRLNVDKVLRRICGWVFNRKLPCEATFSNAFAEFSQSKILETIHAQTVKRELKDDVVFHISRDSTAIEGREKGEKKLKAEKQVAKRGRPKKGEVRFPKPLTRLQKQNEQSLEEMLTSLRGNADYGAKHDSHGNTHVWCGYKLHLDVADGGIPISCVLTPASVHDSGVSIPLQHMTNSRVISLYTLADKAYDSHEIRANIAQSGQVAIIPKNQRKASEMDGLVPFEKRRFRERSTVERANSALKERFTCRNVFVRGAAKVMCHLMFGVLALTAETLLRSS